MAARLGGREGLPGVERAGAAEELRPRDAPVPVGVAAHGAHARVHDRRRRHALPRAKRDARPPSAGLRLVRPAGRERRDPRGRPPAREHRAQHRGHHALVPARRLGVRLGSPHLDARSRLLPLAAVAVPALPRARPRVPEGGAGEVVPERPDRARERAGEGGTLRALRRRGRVAAHGAVVLPDHGLRAGAPRRPRDGRLARVDQGAPAQLDRPLGGRGDPVPDRGAGRGHPRLHDASGHALRRDLLRPRARARARAAHRLRRGARVRAPGIGEEDRRARGRDGEDRRRDRAARGQPGERRAAARLRRRLRPDRLRDGGDHGRPGPRPARLRLRAGVRAPDPPGREAGRRRRRRERRLRRARGGRGARQLRRVRRAAGARGRPADRREPRVGGARQLHRELPPARLGLLAPALLGLPDPRRLLRLVRDGPGARRPAAGRPPGDRGLQAEGRAAARSGRGVGERALPVLRRAGEARGRDDGHVRRLVLVLPALLRPAQRDRAVRPRRRRLLEPGRPLHRRRRPRDRAHDLRALLDQGAERHGPGRVPRAVRAPSTRTAG